MTYTATSGRHSARPAVAEKILGVFLFATVFAGGFVFIEPSPYEAVFILLTLACFFGIVRVDRKILPLLVLLVLWCVGGLLSLAPVAAQESAVRFTAVSLYLALNAVIYACLFCDDPVQRLRLLRAAYIAAATISAASGVAAFFRLVPGLESLLLYDRVRGTFKDPNVFGPFLILPILFIVDLILDRRARFYHWPILPLLLAGLFLSFSRGAWAHFAVSLACMFVFRFLTAPTVAERHRLLVMCTVTLLGLASAAALAILLGFGGELFEQRARLTQYYDVGDGGRFTGHARSIPMLLDRINGFGPMQYREHIGLDAHQVYLNAFAAGGWLGGISYIGIVVSTLTIGLRAVFISTPWQHYLIPVVATYIGVVLEGFVIDTDHWRHYFLLLGLVWGLSIATFNVAQHSRRAAP